MERFDALVRPDREASAAMELISSDGELKELDLEGFKRQEYDLSYCVGIIGPQGSGKSTLLNHLFGTTFPQRDTSTPRRVGMPTTRGVWIAKAEKEPFTLVMDLEGTDGGQDGTAFEKRRAKFALAVAHSLLINMWCHDFGREHASYRPLLRTIFESVITMPMFSPPRKTTLLFVVRDMSSYDESLETPIKEDVQKIWEEVKKPEGRELTPLSDFFNVEYFPMSSYREKRETFEKEVKQLRQKILNSISHGVDRQQWVVPASRFCSILKEKWTTIKQNDNLDLPAHDVMVATTRCEEIVKRTLQLFAQRIWKEAKRWLPPTWVMVGLTILAGLMLFLRVWNRIVFAVSVGVTVAKVMGNVMSICGNILDKIELVPRAHQILNSISHGGHGQWVSRFCSSKELGIIKKNKSLDLPVHMVMVATTLCDQSAEEKLGLFKSNQVWRDLEEAAEISFDAGLGAKISSILNKYLSEYDSETRDLNEGVRNSKREYLKSGVLMLLHPAYIKNLGHLHSEQFQSFKTQLQAHDLNQFAESARRCKESCVEEFLLRCSEAGVEEARWDDDASTERKQLVRDIENHTLVAAAEELQKVVNNCRDRLSRKLNGRLRTLLRSSEEMSWGGIRRAVSEESDAAASELRSTVESFELEQTKVEEKVNDIRQYGRQLVENYWRDLTYKARGVVELMKNRYMIRSSFAQKQTTANEDSINNSSAHQTACRESLKILSVMAAIRLDEGEGDDDYIERVLVSALMPADADGGVQPPQDPLDASEWPHQVITLITPTECRGIWREFTDEMQPDLHHRAHTVQQEMSGAGNSWVPPTWVIVGTMIFKKARFKLLLSFSKLGLELKRLAKAAGDRFRRLTYDELLDFLYDYVMNRSSLTSRSRLVAA